MPACEDAAWTSRRSPSSSTPRGGTSWRRSRRTTRAAELSLQTRLREAGYAPELVAAALLQTQLRARARDKFGTFADGMLFTPDGLEQATRFAVAARHAARYLRAEVRLVHDLGCGIGADAMAFAGLELAVRAVDADAVTATVAGVNLRHWPAAQVVHGRAEDVALPTGEDATHTGVWVDPARRLAGPADARGRSRRVFSLDRISPTWAQVQGYAAQVPATGAKLAPAFPHAAVPRGAEANVPRILLTTSVERASPSTSSATMSSGLPVWTTFSSTGSRSWIELILLWWTST